MGLGDFDILPTGVPDKSRKFAFYLIRRHCYNQPGFYIPPTRYRS